MEQAESEQWKCAQPNCHLPLSEHLVSQAATIPQPVAANPKKKKSAR